METEAVEASGFGRDHSVNLAKTLLINLLSKVKTKKIGKECLVLLGDINNLFLPQQELGVVLPSERQLRRGRA